MSLVVGAFQFEGACAGGKTPVRTICGCKRVKMATIEEMRIGWFSMNRKEHARGKI